jgi:hypothetical protein
MCWISPRNTGTCHASNCDEVEHERHDCDPERDGTWDCAGTGGKGTYWAWARPSRVRTDTALTDHGRARTGRRAQYPPVGRVLRPWRSRWMRPVIIVAVP